MQSLIIGTAGHVDHGKTALVKCLTGVETDRLEEEKRRGISIELGFAPLIFSKDLVCGIVDVPGHGALIRTMVMGATQTDLVLFVVAANEGIQPQTEEHFSILSLLGVKNAILVISKIDLVDESSLRQLTHHLHERFKGSFLDNAPIVSVSARTGEGIEELKYKIFELSQWVIQQPSYIQRSSLPTRIPIDRVFTLSGFGTVVTGPLLTGIVREEDELEVYPLKKYVRVRKIHIYGNPVEEVCAPSRVAINLKGISREELRRGFVLGKPNAFSVSQTAKVRISSFANFDISLIPKRCIFHTATCKVPVQLKKLSNHDEHSLRFDEPICLVNGDRFILRHDMTMGGGEVLEVPIRYPAPEVPGTRLKIPLPIIQDFDHKAKKILVLFRDRTSWEPIGIDEIKSHFSMDSQEVLAILKSLMDQHKIIRFPKGFYLSYERSIELKEKTKEFFKIHSTMQVSDLKEMISVSRKYAIPYLEYFDENKWTIRKGDVRISWKI